MKDKSLSMDPWEDREDHRLQRHLQTIRHYRTLATDEEAALAWRLRGGDREALDDLVNANLHHVVAVARSFTPHGLSCLDLLAEGTVGLIRAAESFDERGGFRFATCARWWILQSIQRALDERIQTERAMAIRSRTARVRSKKSPVSGRRASEQERNAG